MLTEYNGFKLCDRVYWDGGGFTENVDHGTISKVGGEVFFFLKMSADGMFG